MNSLKRLSKVPLCREEEMEEFTEERFCGMASAKAERGDPGLDAEEGTKDPKGERPLGKLSNSLCCSENGHYAEDEDVQYL